LTPFLGLLRYANFIFFAIALACTYRILNKNVSPVAAVIAVGIAALYPLFYYSSGTFYPQMLGAALMLCCFCLVDQLREPKGSVEFFLGCLYGWLVLVIPLYALYLPCFASYPWIFKRPKKIRAVCLLVLGAGLVVGCWTVRNAITFHEFIPISTNDGVNILLGNNENMTPNIGVNADIREYQHVARNMSDIEKNAYYRKIAFQWVYDNPGKALKNYFLKAINFFGYTNKLAQQSEQTPVRDFVLFVSYYPLLLLAVLRLCYMWKYPLHDMEKLIVVFFIASPFIHAIFFTRLRFRVPFDFLTIMLAASYVSYRLGVRSR
jgi:4-amino-4-deoxy-L-arabinose transferase-like glycosyltransferase